MSTVKRPAGDRLVLSPMEPLTSGRSAEAFERHVQQMLRNGYRHLVIDLAGVPSIDDSGIRALVRGHTSARRNSGSLRLASLTPAVRQELEDSHLAGVFEIYGSVESARLATLPWRTIRLVLLATLLCGTLVWAGLKWPLELTGLGTVADELTSGKKGSAAIPQHQLMPFIELLKLVAAAMIGLLVTAVHQPASRDRARSMEQAQVLLSVSGAMMMIIIADSLARAFGIAGAASIIRFRTPVDDPKDVTILFLLMGLGMSAGLGAFAVAGLGTAFLCIALWALARVSANKARTMSVEILADGRQFPTTHVEGVFARNDVVFEPREISQADDVTVKYHTWLDPRISLEDLSSQLMEPSAGLKSVTWEIAKREKA
jgi:anti-anti-sigma factor